MTNTEEHQQELIKNLKTIIQVILKNHPKLGSLTTSPISNNWIIDDGEGNVNLRFSNYNEGVIITTDQISDFSRGHFNPDSIVPNADKFKEEN